MCLARASRASKWLAAKGATAVVDCEDFLPALEASEPATEVVRGAKKGAKKEPSRALLKARGAETLSKTFNIALVLK